MAKNTGKVREFCQSGKVGTLFELHTLYHVMWNSVFISFAILRSCSTTKLTVTMNGKKKNLGRVYRILR